MKTTIKKINIDEWEEARKTSNVSSVFLQQKWVSMVEKSFSLRFVRYLAKTPEGSFLIPCYIYDDFLYQVGFIGYGGPLPVFGAPESLNYLDDMVQLISDDLQRKCRRIVAYPSDLLAYKSGKMLGRSSQTNIIRLAQDSDHMFRNVISGNARNSIRKAQKNNVTVKLIAETDLSWAHYLLTSTQKRVGSPYCTDFLFFQRMYASNICHFWGGYLNNLLVCISVFIQGENEVFYYLNGTDLNYRSCCPNYMVLWQAIKNSIADHKNVFDMGISHYDSLVAFKKKWGTASVGVINIGD
ncbi:MAG: GNAT family N-acetyltransferase [Holosporaceae bacterium]|jgi:hypothetical protein|nr:GNAT family N-acetyltransferase [Holosporaceae bacterium]